MANKSHDWFPEVRHMHASLEKMGSWLRGTCGRRREERFPDGFPIPVRYARDETKFTNVPFRCRQIMEVPEYWMHDIRPDDLVLDIGANIGAFCIRAARLSRHVTAVEPVTSDLLQQNIRLNNVRVPVIRAALGKGGVTAIVWDGCRVLHQTYPLRDLVRIAGGCDFLKCDCEGAEWEIDPSDLAGIRRIEMELHQPPIGNRPEPAFLDYICRHYEFIIEQTPVYGPLGQRGILHAWT
jgi:FkbM family methyltransferase